MMAMVGENLTNEWEKEPFGTELWDALALVRKDTHQGIAALEALVAQGSTLGMMYLGQYHYWGDYGVREDRGRAKELLSAATEKGSIEGAYRLAKILRNEGESNQAFLLWTDLAERGFSPALYLIGYHYYLGEVVPRDIKKAAHFLSIAESRGHLLAKRLNAIILINSGNLGEFFKGLIKFVACIAPYIKTKRDYPQSDSLRN